MTVTGAGCWANAKQGWRLLQLGGGLGWDVTHERSATHATAA